MVTRRRDKEIRWVGSSYDDLMAFPVSVRREAGFQLGRLQAGLAPEEWKPFSSAGQGAEEIRPRDQRGTFRIIYVARMLEAVYVLHCFQKKTHATLRRDVQIAATRFRAIARAGRDHP